MEEGERKYHVGHRIRKLDNMLKRNMQLALSGQGVDEVTAANGFIIMYLYHHSDQAVHQRDIEREFKICRSAVTNILTRMEENGLIHRETDGSDARLKRLTLTARGKEYCQLLHNTIKWLECRQLGSISPEERDQFFATLERIEGNAARLAAQIQSEDDSWIKEIREGT